MKMKESLQNRIKEREKQLKEIYTALDDIQWEYAYAKSKEEQEMLQKIYSTTREYYFVVEKLKVQEENELKEVM